MNLFKRMCGGFGFGIKTKVIQEKTFFCGDLPRCGVKLMAAMVFLPCLIEPSFSEPVNILTKDNNRLAVLWERFNQDVTDSFSPIRTLYLRETFRESGYKFFGRNAKGISVPNVHGDHSGDHAANKGSFWSSNRHDDGLSAIGLISSLWLMFWVANLNAPNSKSNQNHLG